MRRHLNQVSSRTGDLILSADMDRLARAQFYDAMQRRLELAGEAMLAKTYSSLARESYALVSDRVREEMPPATQLSVTPLNVGVVRDTTACSTSYDAWAIAVDVETAATVRLIELLSRAEDVRVKLLLLGRVRETATRAANYRIHRRAAYHSEKISEARIPFPDVRRIQSVGDLLLVALSIEQWLLRLFSNRNMSLAANEIGVRLTRNTIDELKERVNGSEPPRRLTNWLNRLDSSPRPGEVQAVSDQLWQLRLTAEAGRVFDYYDRIFSGAESEEMLWEAQILASGALERLAAICECD